MEDEAKVQVTDHSLLNFVHRHREVRLKDARNVETIVTNQNRMEPLPEVLTSKLEDTLGDAGAAVTVGADLATSIEFGNKAGAFVSVKATCHNSTKEIAQVHDILWAYVNQIVQEDYAQMADVRAKAMAGVPVKGQAVVAPQQMPARSVPLKATTEPIPAAGRRPAFKR